MPAALALPAFWGAVSAGAAGTAGVIGAKMQSGAMDDASKAQTAANDKAIAFQREQAQNDFRNQEVARRANYDQWAAKTRSMGTIRQALGLRPMDIPDYVPSVDPNFTGPMNTQVDNPYYRSRVVPGTLRSAVRGA